MSHELIFWIYFPWQLLPYRNVLWVMIIVLQRALTIWFGIATVSISNDKSFEKSFWRKIVLVTILLAHPTSVYPELKIPKLQPYTPADKWVLRTKGNNLPIKFNINTSNMKISGFKQMLVNQFAWVFDVTGKIDLKYHSIKIKILMIRLSIFCIVVFDQIWRIPEFNRK